ncbi:MAG: hypothetical protein ACF8K1_09115, partial [Phycisphaerales bacterium JB047]
MTLQHQYGRFIENDNAYEITDHRTPRPWTNVVSNGRYGFVVSQNGAGFSWLDHCQLNVLTRWSMDHIRDDRGKFIYLSDLDEDCVWSATPHPSHTNFDPYPCVHPRGSTTIETTNKENDTDWTHGVAQ